MAAHETVLILDFGGQYTQLIARRVRELGVYSEIVPYNVPFEAICSRSPRALILSGGPRSVYEQGAPRCDRRILDLGVPVLGICYGLQLLAHYLGGRVEAAPRREYGAAQVTVQGVSPLFTGLPSTLDVWMSHGDEVKDPPSGFVITGLTDRAIAAIEDPQRRLYGVQFHPEVAHTPLGREILRRFLFDVCRLKGDWQMESFIETTVARIEQEIGQGRAVCALSGGVDSSVAAALVARAIGSRLTCIFVDNGLLRQGEFEQVLEIYRRRMELNVIGVRAAERFLSRLRGVTDPEAKRKIIGAEFIAVFQDEAARLGAVDYLV
ncbi:MAG TPA: glutamine-hydrolyzing GMP synthase, partial [Blastocatellia bacterium]|nr:glutamine-hydrolyzing GMP synthase [Blastocatellia bacterium]